MYKNNSLNSSKYEHYSNNTIKQFINCSNELCFNGGFNVREIIDEMVIDEISKKEGYEMCQGYEGSPKGRNYYGKCYNRFEYKIKIDYKPIK